MSAQYLVTFNDGHCEWIHSADAKSFKRRDIRAAYIKAREKAEAKRRKTDPSAKATGVRCVG